MRKAQKPAEVRIAAQVASDDDDLLAVHLERGADDRLDSELAAGLEELHCSVDAAAVGDRERRHLELRRPHHQLGWMRPAVKEREVGVAVQLDIRRHYFDGPVVSQHMRTAAVLLAILAVSCSQAAAPVANSATPGSSR